MKIGVICPSEIAFRRFMPSLKKDSDFQFIGLGVASAEEAGGKVITGQREKAEEFISLYGGCIYNSYEDLVTSDDIECVYLPLPPALHYKWAKIALENGKHVLVEKPSTINTMDTSDLLRLAREKNLALHENYMFVFHKQIKEINDIVSSGEIGDVRLYRINFGFPMRSLNDFRYNKALGGGALIDAGGYTLKYASLLLGDTAKLCCAQKNYISGFEVDMYGSGMLINKDGITAQVAFGMDNNYKCELEIWGSKGTLYTNRVLTAPVGFSPEVIIRKGNDEERKTLSEDDSFYNSIQYFKKCINDETIRQRNFNAIQRQANLVSDFMNFLNV